MKTIRPPVKWHGGKHYLCHWIIEQFPEHRIYVEPFGGGASVLLNKNPCDVEAYNDLDERIVRLFRVLRKNGQGFLDAIRLVPYSEKEFKDASEYPDSSDETEKAICDFIRWRQSFGGKGLSFSYSTKRARGAIAGDVNAWWTAIDGLGLIVDRLKMVELFCRPAAELIKRFDDREALIYCDPPYIHETREVDSCNSYKCEMTDTDHEELAGVLVACKSMVALSGYRCDRYDEWYKGWRRIDREISCHAAGGKIKARKIECLWMNW